MLLIILGYRFFRDIDSLKSVQNSVLISVLLAYEKMPTSYSLFALALSLIKGITDDTDDECTTAAFFFEYLPYSLKELIENKRLNNTHKTKIALEVAFGMSFIHKQKQIHRNLNVDNIRLNNVFESKIINFSQVHVSDLFESNQTLTK